MLDTDIVHYKSANVPTNDSSMSGGAIDTGSPLAGVSVGNLIPKGTYPSLGGSPVVWYYSAHVKNTHGTDTFYGGKIWLPNAIGSFASNGTLSAVSSSILDRGYVLRVYGMNSVRAIVSEDITLSGTTPVSGTTTWLAGSIYKVEVLDSITFALKTANGNIALTRGTAIGTIPGPMGDVGSQVSFDFATAEYAIALEPSLGTSTTTTNRLTVPTTNPLTFSVPRTQGTALSIHDMAPGTHQQYWLQWTGNPGTQRTTRSRLVVFVLGTD